MEDIRVIIDDAAARGIYRKTVLSRSTDKSIRRCTVSLFRSSHGQTEAQCEYLRQDGKAVHENFPPELLGKRITELLSGYRQADILTTAGSCTVMISHSGSMHIKNGIKTDGGERAELKTHDRDKQRFLSPDAPFLRPLGISDERGRVLDSRRSKYRQINRFLELLDDVYPKLPQKGTLTVCDLCCGKSVLAFAVYHYLTSVRGREVDMYGIDLKPDVIELSERIARESGCTGLHFVCGDVSRFTPPSPPSLVLSLHACDTATDLVLSLAVRYGAKVILSTPCCHHEIFSQLSELPPMLAPAYSCYPILRGKLADSLTDGLRCARLEMEGYKVQTVELVDPDDTPKNVLIRAVRGRYPSEAKRAELHAAYNATLKAFGISPSLDRLINADRDRQRKTEKTRKDREE